MSTFFCILTSIGEAKLANATALGQTLEFSQMAVGDGGGSLPTPNQSQTALINEVRRKPLNAVEIDADNPNWIVCEQVIPADEGGWTIREVGIYDVAGDLVAVGNFPETYKPVLAEGSGRTQTVRMVLQVSNSASVTLKIDPSVVLATRQYVDKSSDDHLAEAKAYSEDAGNLARGRVPDDRLSGRYNIVVPVAESLSSDAGRLFTDVNSTYFSNNVNKDRYTRIGNGYASRIWLDRAVGSIKIQYGGYGLAGTSIAWRDVFTVSGEGSVVQFVGMVSHFPSLSAPPGWIKLQGGELSRSTYSALFSFAVSSGNMASSESDKNLGQFGPGDGSTTFTLPDPQGMTLRVLDEGGLIDPEREIGSYQSDQIKSHTHEYDTMQGSGITNSVSDNIAASGNVSAATGRTTGATGGDETTVKNIAWPLYIKY